MNNNETNIEKENDNGNESENKNDSKNENTYKIKSLAPTYDSVEEPLYEDFINDALQQPETENGENLLNNKYLNRNIAITGGYGVGKSSVIKTFFKNRKNYNPVYITMGAYNNKKIDEDKVEFSILQQILYVKRPHELFLSRFRRIDKDSEELKKVHIYFTAIIIYLLLLYDYIKYDCRLIATPIKIIFDTIPMDLSKCYALIGAIYKLIICVIIIFPIFYLIKKISRLFTFKQVDINMKNVKANLTSQDDSILNNNVEELINFFKYSDYDVVVFEDIDRIDNPVRIFSKLKEINDIINSSINNKTIRFIYVLKDGVFGNALERVKFFDVIIPIVPIARFGNSREYLLRVFGNLVDRENNNNEFGAIKEDIINDIAHHIHDYRTIVELYNEYIIYLNYYKKGHEKDIINTSNKRELEKYNEENTIQLLYLILYKILYANKFNSLEKNKGPIAYYFSSEFTKINKKENIKTKIEKLKDINGMMKSGFYDFSYDKQKKSKGNDNDQEFNLSNNINSNITILDTKNNNTSRSNDSNDNNTNQKNNENNPNILNDFEIMLINNKIIRSNYMWLISAKTEDSLTVQQENIISNIKDNKKINVNKKTFDDNDTIQSILYYLSRYDFRNDSICIEALFKYICSSNNKKYKDYLEEFYDELSITKLDFIIKCEETNIHILNLYRESLNKIWEYIRLDRKKISNQIDKMVILTIENYNKKTNYINDDSYFYEVMQEENIIKVLSTSYLRIEENLKKVDVLFSQKIDIAEFKNHEKLYTYIYENNKFAVCLNNIALMSNNKYIKSYKLFETWKNEDDSSKISSQYEGIDIFNDKEKRKLLVDELYNNKIVQEDSSKFMEHNFFNSFSDEELVKLMKIEKYDINNISRIDKKYYKLLKNKIVKNWNNLLALYESESGELKKYSIKIIKENFNDLCNNSNVGIKLIDKIFAIIITKDELTQNITEAMINRYSIKSVGYNNEILNKHLNILAKYNILEVKNKAEYNQVMLKLNSENKKIFKEKYKNFHLE